MARIENFQFSVQDAFKECFYVVPDYQREYVWKDREVRQLLDDINEQVDGSDDSEYFVGTVLVSKQATSGNHEVIDGQQRLTTFFLILCALRAQVSREDSQLGSHIGSLIESTYSDKSGNTQTKLHLDPQYENAGEVIRMIAAVNGSPSDVTNAIESAGIGTYGAISNLTNAYETICDYLTENYPESSDKKRFWGYLANQVVFIQIKTDISTALKIFETINERGVGLNPMDLVKNLLFSQVRDSDFTRLKTEWKEVTRPLEQNGEKPLRFLRYFIMANYDVDSDRKDPIVREDEIYDWFRKPNSIAATGYVTDPFSFVRKLRFNTNSFLNFRRGLRSDGQQCPELARLHELTGGAFSLHFVLLLAGAGLRPELFVHLVVQLESLLFYYVFSKTQAKEIERNFASWAKDLRKIPLIADEAAQRQALDFFIADKIAPSMAGKSADLEASLQRYTYWSMQKYRTRYLLTRVAQFVDDGFHGVHNTSGYRRYHGAQIEHILPATPSTALSEQWRLDHPEDDYRYNCSRLGNLSFLEAPLNNVASNNFFELKKSEYAKSSFYLTRSINALASVGENTSVSRVNRHLKPFESWGPQTIADRQQMLVSISKLVWGLRRLDGTTIDLAMSSA
jgi:hypothetical protein